MLGDPAQNFSFSPVILLTMLAVLAASSAVFWLLSWRATSRRQWVTFSDWGREAGFHFRPLALTDIPSPFDSLAGVRSSVRQCLSGGTTTLMQFQTEPGRRPAAAAPGLRGNDDADPFPADPFSAVGLAGAGVTVAVAPSRHDVWHVLIRHLDADWKPTGLRPAGSAVSTLDLFPLSVFPRLGDPERFAVYATDSEAARALAGSFAPALLPRDVGLLLHGRHLVLDFSDRPFDTIEFNRMRALAEQLAGHVTAQG